MWKEKRLIYDITPFSMIDYPDITSCILWFAGCNMRCTYCYNPDIVFGKGKKRLSEALTFAESRKGLLDGVVMSGGECTLYKEIIPLAHALKAMGMKVKIDTNGSRPDRMRTLLTEQLVDYVSLDFKAMPGRFEMITHSDVYTEFEETLDLLLCAGKPFEVRTTIHSSLLPDEEIRKMADHLIARGYRGKYFLQNFMNDTPTVGDMDERHQRLNTLAYSGSAIEIVIRN